MRRAPHRFIEGCLIAAHGIQSQSVFIYIRGEYLTEYEVLSRRRGRGARRRRLRRLRRRRPPRRRRLHLRRGVGAARLARGQARPAAAPPAVPAGDRPLRRPDARQQRPDDRQRPRDPRARRRGLLGARRRGCAGHRRLLALRQRQQARELRAPARDDAARADLRARPRRRRRTRPEGDHPRRLVGAGLHAGPDRRPARLRRRPGRRLVPRLGGDHRRGRPRLHGAARAAGGEVLHARVMRQVHALPRGDALARPAARADRGRRGHAVRPRPRCGTSATGSSASRSARSATSPSTASRATWTSSTTSSSATWTRAAARSAAHRRSTGSWRRATPTSTRTCRWCPHELGRAGHARRRRRRGAGAEGPRPGRDRGRRGHRDPGVLLRAADRAADRRLPHVPRRGRGPGEAPGRLHADRAGRDGRADRADVREGGRRPERDARVHPRQPPARLPGLRQGRRVPAAGPDVPLRARQHADDVSEADVRQADPDQPADRARPRALHPLLPLHALLRRGLGGRPADRAQPRRAVRDRDLRGRAVPRPVHRQRDRALSRSARSPRRRTGSRRGPGRSRTSRPCAACARSAATSRRRRARGRSSGSSPATIRRSTAAGSATRAGSRTATCRRRIVSSTRCARPLPGTRSSRGTTRWTRPRR